MREMVLLINFQDKKKLANIRTILMTQKILGKQITKGSYAQPLGALVGIKTLEKKDAIYEGEELENEMMVFVNLPNSKLDYILEAMKKKGIPRVDHKAVLTPTNSGWTIPELYEELAKEHAQFHPN